MFRNDFILKIAVILSCVPFLYANDQNESLANNDEAVILCTAERNMIRMECYTLSDFKQERVFLPKKERANHCFLELNMQQEGFNLLGISWNQEMPGYLAIETGKTASPDRYYINMFSLFELADTRLADAVLVCLEGFVEPIAKEAMETPGRKKLDVRGTVSWIWARE